MSISSFVIHSRPENIESVRDALNLMNGVEVHAITEEGRLVVTVDQPDNGEAVETFSKFGELDGVLSSSLIYNYFENDTAEKELAR